MTRRFVIPWPSLGVVRVQEGVDARNADYITSLFMRFMRSDLLVKAFCIVCLSRVAVCCFELKWIRCCFVFLESSSSNFRNCSISIVFVFDAQLDVYGFRSDRCRLRRVFKPLYGLSQTCMGSQLQQAPTITFRRTGG